MGKVITPLLPQEGGCDGADSLSPALAQSRAYEAKTSPSSFAPQRRSANGEVSATLTLSTYSTCTSAGTRPARPQRRILCQRHVRSRAYPLDDIAERTKPGGASMETNPPSILLSSALRGRPRPGGASTETNPPSILLSSPLRGGPRAGWHPPSPGQGCCGHPPHPSQGCCCHLLSRRQGGCCHPPSPKQGCRPSRHPPSPGCYHPLSLRQG